MKTINKIMVAVDFSEHSKKAVQYATQLAQEVRAELLFVNVINQIVCIRVINKQR